MTLAVVIAIAITLAMTPVAKKLAWKFDAVARPDGKRKRHARPTPLWGGGSVYLAVLLSVTLAYYFYFRGSNIGIPSLPALPAALALSAGLLCVLGCYDDLFDMRARWKLIGQILSIIPIIIAGGCVHRLVILGCSVELGMMGIVFTIGWLVLGINALNLLDGMDGLASTVGIGISIGVAAIAATHGHTAAMLLALALAGSLAGFLVYNLPPARIYLGDCGSMIIGLTLALLVLRVSSRTPNSPNLTVAAALLFVPLLDTGLAVIRRTLNGSGFMVADHGHVHHRLLDRGFNIWKALAFLGGLCLTTSAVAWLASASGYELWAWGVLAGITLFLVNRQLLGHGEWYLAKQLMARMTPRQVGAVLARISHGIPSFLRETASRLVLRRVPTEPTFQLRVVVPPDVPRQVANEPISSPFSSTSAATTRREDSRAAA